MFAIFLFHQIRTIRSELLILSESENRTAAPPPLSRVAVINECIKGAKARGVGKENTFAGESVENLHRKSLFTSTISSKFRLAPPVLHHPAQRQFSPHQKLSVPTHLVLLTGERSLGLLAYAVPRQAQR